MVEEDIPLFAKIVFMDKFNKNCLKQRILDEVVLRYINDEEYKNEISNVFLVILDREDYIFSSSTSFYDKNLPTTKNPKNFIFTGKWVNVKTNSSPTSLFFSEMIEKGILKGINDELS